MQVLRSGTAVTLLAAGLSVLWSLQAMAAEGVAGVWEYKDPAAAANSITFTLNADGTGKVDDEAIQYTVEGTTIKVVNGNDTTAYTFKIDGDTMVVSGGDLEKPTTFVRKGAGAAPRKGLGSKIKAMEVGVAGKGEGAAKGSALDVAGTVGGATGPATADAAKAAAKEPGPIGLWQAADGDQMEIRADALVYKGVAIPAVLGEKGIRLTANGQAIECPFEVSGDSMNITINGQPLALKRVGGPPLPPSPAAGAEKKADAAAGKPAAGEGGAKSLVGTWESPEGSVIVRADGTVRSNGSEGKYTVDDQFITLSDDKQWVKIPYKLDGDKLVLGNGPSKTLTRSAGGPAGVYTVTESSLDPKFFMSITHYLTLYPDGAVGFAKSEGGATRTQVTENFERFRSWRENAGRGGKSYGKWTADENGGVTIQWNGAFNNATWRGRVDAKTGKLVMPGAGILNEGATLGYERQ